QEPFFLGGSVPRRGRERGSIQEPPLAEGQPPYAAHSQSVCQCRSQVERNYFPDHLRPTRVAPRTQSDHRRHCPSPLSPNLDHSAPGGALRRTRPRSERKLKTQAHYSDYSVRRGPARNRRWFVQNTE